MSRNTETIAKKCIADLRVQHARALETLNKARLATSAAKSAYNSADAKLVKCQDKQMGALSEVEAAERTLKALGVSVD